jgi:uncharacterized protein YcbX
MKLQDIYIYPIKSLGGIRLQEATAEIRGFQWDRRWMLVDENGSFLSQRTIHRMSLLQVCLEPEGLRVVHKHQPELTHWIPLEPETNKFIPVSIWKDSVIGQQVNQESNVWFSQMLQFPCRLVHMPIATERNIDIKYSENQETVSFADAMPYLIIGQSSLDDLNERLSAPVPMDRFRPNLVFSGGEPYREDNWKKVKIGDCLFKITKPCSRCVMTTVDQKTAITGKEPLKTLAQYRTVDKKVIFGQNMISLTTGRLRVGDVVQPIG